MRRCSSSIDLPLLAARWRRVATRDLSIFLTRSCAVSHNDIIAIIELQEKSYRKNPTNIKGQTHYISIFYI